MLTAEDIRVLVGDPLPLTAGYAGNSYRPYYEFHVGPLQIQIWRRHIEPRYYFDVTLRVKIEWLQVNLPKNGRMLLSEELMFQEVANILNDLEVGELRNLADSLIKVRSNGPTPRGKSALARINEEDP